MPIPDRIHVPSGQAHAGNMIIASRQQVGETDLSFISAEKILRDALGAWENSNTHKSYTAEEAAGARSGIRDLMVRLGLYHIFNESKSERSSE